MTEQVLPKAANFGDLALNLGNNMEIDAQLIDIGPIERTKQKGTPFQKCILKDQGGNQTKATIWQGRTGTALAEINRNKWLTFNLSASKYRGESQYGGFWQMEAPVISQAPPTSPQPLQQANPVASSIVQGIQMPSTYAYPVTPETQERIVRSVGAEVAGKVVAAWITKEGITFDISGKLLEIADMMAMWIKTGTTNAPEPQSNEVCPDCQQSRVDCTCPTEPFVR